MSFGFASQLAEVLRAGDDHGLEASEAFLWNTVEQAIDGCDNVERGFVVFVRLADDDVVLFIHFSKLTSRLRLARQRLA